MAFVTGIIQGGSFLLRKGVASGARAANVFREGMQRITGLTNAGLRSAKSGAARAGIYAGKRGALWSAQTFIKWFFPLSRGAFRYFIASAYFTAGVGRFAALLAKYPRLLAHPIMAKHTARFFRSSINMHNRMRRLYKTRSGLGKLSPEEISAWDNYEKIMSSGFRWVDEAGASAKFTADWLKQYNKIATAAPLSHVYALFSASFPGKWKGFGFVVLLAELYTYPLFFTTVADLFKSDSDQFLQTVGREMNQAETESWLDQNELRINELVHRNQKEHLAQFVSSMAEEGWVDEELNSWASSLYEYDYRPYTAGSLEVSDDMGEPEITQVASSIENGLRKLLGSNREVWSALEAIHSALQLIERGYVSIGPDANVDSSFDPEYSLTELDLVRTSEENILSDLGALS